jgi:hypothetical protein
MPLDTSSGCLGVQCLGYAGDWRDALESGAVVAFHDYDHPDHPGVREAIASLQLLGQKCGGLFVWRAP